MILDQISVPNLVSDFGVAPVLQANPSRSQRSARVALRNAPLRTPLRVTHILFSVVRELCEEIGVAEGVEVIRTGDRDTTMLVELPARRRVELEHALTRFIEVEPTAPST